MQTHGRPPSLAQIVEVVPTNRTQGSYLKHGALLSAVSLKMEKAGICWKGKLRSAPKGFLRFGSWQALVTWLLRTARSRNQSGIGWEERGLESENAVLSHNRML